MLDGVFNTAQSRLVYHFSRGADGGPRPGKDSVNGYHDANTPAHVILRIDASVFERK
jgi:hypothetical protein